MSRLLDASLERLVNLLFEMGELAEKTVSLALEGYVEEKDVHEQVQRWSDVLVQLSEEVDDKAFELIARYQPVASDLRMIQSYMKIGYDFSRYARWSWDISFIHQRLKLEKCDPWMKANKMSQKVLKMVHTSVEAVKNRNAELAKTLAKTEEEVDSMYFKYLDDLAEKGPTATKCLIANVLTVRYLERIADHATYIGESVVYIATGEKVSLR